MKAVGKIMARFKAAVETAKRQNVATMNLEKRPEYECLFLCFKNSSCETLLSGIREFNFRNSLFYAPESFEEPLNLSRGGSIYGGRGELLVLGVIIYICWYQRKKSSRKMVDKVVPHFKTPNRYEVMKLSGDAHLPYQKI